MTDDGHAPGSPIRDRDRLRRGRPARRRVWRELASGLASIVWEVVGELVFLVLVGLVSWLVYEELRWPFIATVFFSVNAVLLLIAVVAWARGRRRSRRS